MAIEFHKNFKKCAVIIDCFEIYIKHPTSLTARALTTKKQNTVKFLSHWDWCLLFQKDMVVHLTEHSGLLKNLLPGDVILADHGFTIQDSTGMYGAELKILPLVKSNLVNLKLILPDS